MIPSYLDSLSVPETLPRLCDPLEEAWIVFQFVIEPIVFRSKSHQDARRLSMPGDNDLLIFRQAEVVRQVILDFRQCYLFHRFHRVLQARNRPRILSREINMSGLGMCSLVGRPTAIPTGDFTTVSASLIMKCAVFGFHQPALLSCASNDVASTMPYRSSDVRTPSR
jgi:hypothetical protein